MPTWELSVLYKTEAMSADVFSLPNVAQILLHQNPKHSLPLP